MQASTSSDINNLRWMAELPCFDDLDLHAAPLGGSWKYPENKVPGDSLHALQQLPLKHDIRLRSTWSAVPGGDTATEDKYYQPPKEAVEQRLSRLRMEDLQREDRDHPPYVHRRKRRGGYDGFITVWNLPELRPMLEQYLTAADIARLQTVLGAKGLISPPQEELTRLGCNDLLRHIFPGEQADIVRDLMRPEHPDALGITLIGDGVEDFLKRKKNPTYRAATAPDRKTHLLMIVTPMHSPVVNGTIRLEQLMSDQHFTSQLPGVWRNAFKPSHRMAESVLHSIHLNSAANRRLFAFSSTRNDRDRKTMTKLDTDSDLLVQWIRRDDPNEDNEEWSGHYKVEEGRMREWNEGGCILNQYMFHHYRRTKAEMEELLCENEYVTYLNLHEREWTIRTAGLRDYDFAPWPPPRVYGTLRHQALLTLQYTITSENATGNSEHWHKNVVHYDGIRKVARLQLFRCCRKTRCLHLDEDPDKMWDCCHCANGHRTKILKGTKVKGPRAMSRPSDGDSWYELGDTRGQGPDGKWISAGFMSATTIPHLPPLTCPRYAFGSPSHRGTNGEWSFAQLRPPTSLPNVRQLRNLTKPSWSDQLVRRRVLKNMIHRPVIDLDISAYVEDNGWDVDAAFHQWRNHHSAQIAAYPQRSMWDSTLLEKSEEEPIEEDCSRLSVEINELVHQILEGSLYDRVPLSRSTLVPGFLKYLEDRLGTLPPEKHEIFIEEIGDCWYVQYKCNYDADGSFYDATDTHPVNLLSWCQRREGYVPAIEFRGIGLYRARPLWGR